MTTMTVETKTQPVYAGTVETDSGHVLDIWVEGKHYWIAEVVTKGDLAYYRSWLPGDQAMTGPLMAGASRAGMEVVADGRTWNAVMTHLWNHIRKNDGTFTRDEFFRLVETQEALTRWAGRQW